ncbi:MAG TPA: hypothetical protein VKQ30_18395 [Ktedonobacterales bacterium]|nr:hypothetical protein [Ktedonobacterales bacterium]
MAMSWREESLWVVVARRFALWRCGLVGMGPGASVPWRAALPLDVMSGLAVAVI